MRTVLVTGHSKGIGLAITQALLKSHHCVVGVSRSAIDSTALSSLVGTAPNEAASASMDPNNAKAELPETLHKNLYEISADLSDLNVVQQLGKQLAAINSPFGDPTYNPVDRPSHKPSDDVSHKQSITLLSAIDAVVCNAGAGHFGALENFSAAQIEKSLQLNLISPLTLVRSLLPSLKAHDRSDIIFMGSESGVQAGRFGSLYSAAKFGLRGAAQSLRAECASNNCHVGIVNPGMVRTTFFDNLSFEPGDAAQHALNAHQVADAVMSLINTADNAVIEEINVRPLQHVVQKKKPRD